MSQNYSQLWPAHLKKLESGRPMQDLKQYQLGFLPSTGPTSMSGKPSRVSRVTKSLENVESTATLAIILCFRFYEILPMRRSVSYIFSSTTCS